VTLDELPVLRAQLSVERARLRRVVAQIDGLLRDAHSRTPSLVEQTAAAAFLHNFYNAIENCLVRVAHGIDEAVPTGHGWHRLLVDQMSAPIEGIRPAVLDGQLAAETDEYRRFRHAFRHMYFFDLDWSRVRPLLEGAAQLAGKLERALDGLLVTLLETDGG